MVLILVGVGVFGCLGLSVLCPLLAFFAYFFQRNISQNKEVGSTNVLSLQIIIPAYNEADRIGDTLNTMARAIEVVKKTHPFASVSIRVGADGCTDTTATIAQSFSAVTVSESAENRSKWATLKHLLLDSTADWVIFVDSGTLWPETFLSEFMHTVTHHAQAIGVAPSYKPLKAGLIARILWSVETTLKRLESRCGGPVSLHGATVGYKTVPLKKALAYLGDTHWLNDDVVFPLVLRGLYPQNLILYPVSQIQDAGARQDQMDFGRRKRMLRGNLQWMTTLLPACFRMNPVAGIISLRRVFRLFWAYWPACFVLAAAFTFHWLILPAVIAAGILATISGSFRQLAGAAAVSLLAPFQWLCADARQPGAWQ